MQLLSAWLNDATISLHYRVGKLDFLVFIIGIGCVAVSRTCPANVFSALTLKTNALGIRAELN